MTDLDLDELDRLDAAATAGPWEYDGSEIAQHWTCEDENGKQTMLDVVGLDENERGCMVWHDLILSNADGELIVAARNALPVLVARVRELESQLAATDSDNAKGDR